MDHKRWFSPSSCSQDTAQDLWSRASIPRRRGIRSVSEPVGSKVPGLLLPVTNAKSALGTSSKMCWGEALPGGDSTLKKARAFFPLPLPSYQGLPLFLSSSIPLAPSRGSKCLFQSPGIPIPAQGGRQRAQAWPVWEGPVPSVPVASQ